MNYKITIGLPVFNEEANIKKLVRSILDQRLEGAVIERVIVSSDGSTDGTVKKARSIKDPRVIVLVNKDRKGIARGLNQIIKNTSSDILVTLDGDIKIGKRNFISKLISPIRTMDADLTSSSIREIMPETYISKVLNISMKLKEVLFKVFKDGNNIYNCHGLARAYSKKFYSQLSFPISIGNDMYCYLKAKSKGFKFVYTPEAKAYYKLPENFDDHKKQSERFFVSEEEMEKEFGKEIVRNEVSIPMKTYLKATLKALPILSKYPKESISYFFMQLYLRLKPKDEAKNQAWNMATSSKNI